MLRATVNNGSCFSKIECEWCLEEIFKERAIKDMTKIFPKEDYPNLEIEFNIDGVISIERPYQPKQLKLWEG